MSAVQDAYMATVDRLELDVSPVDRDAALTSLAISAKRQADTLDQIAKMIKLVIGETADDRGFVDVRDGGQA